MGECKDCIHRNKYKECGKLIIKVEDPAHRNVLTGHFMAPDAFSCVLFKSLKSCNTCGQFDKDNASCLRLLFDPPDSSFVCSEWIRRS